MASLRDRERDRVLGAVRHGSPGLVFEVRGHDALVPLVRLAEVVDVEELRCDRVAAVVALTLLGIDMHAYHVASRPAGNARPTALISARGSRGFEPAYGDTLRTTVDVRPLAAASG